MITTIEEINEVKIIRESEKTLISLGTLKHETKFVFIKKNRSEFPDPNDIANLQHEYTLLKTLEDVPGVIKTHGLIHSDHNLILILEHFESIPLKEYLTRSEGLTLENFFTIAIYLITTIAKIHAHHVIHKNINPENILINPETLKIKIIDFSIASQLAEEIKDVAHPDVLEGTLAYIAPEQTGRMNRPVDYRSDYYSLGITLYELLADKVPFRSKDPVEIMYSHIAKLPPPIEGIPKQLNLLIAKLLAKNADDRYISAKGIKFDLEKCAKEWAKEGKISEFVLGQRDGFDVLNVSHKLYGREAQIQQLLRAYNRIAQGGVELMLVTGYSGIGKTSLVREVHKPMTRENGIFLFGKFDQLQKNIPYHPFAQAFGRFIQQILSEPEDALEKKRLEIQQAVGKLGQVIIQLIPDLELLIGKQPEVPDLPSNESQNRLLIVFQDFIHVFAKQDHPLILFLDDLQWADTASLKLMEILLSDSSMQCLFLIGAYRDNEVEEGHPLLSTLNNLKKIGIKSENIRLNPLSEEDTTRLLIDSLHHSATYLQPLSTLIYSKTGGNPFFLNQFIKTIYKEHLLFYNFKLSAWEWNSEEIKRMKNTDNIVDLMVHNIQKLSPDSIHLLTLASCIGNTFNFQTLATVSEKSIQKISGSLMEILKSGLILPADEKYKRVIEEEGLKEFPELLEDEIDYNFLHDRVYQAAYKIIPDDTKQPTHLQIGRLLLKKIKVDAKSSDLFDIMNHFVKSLSLITDEEEKRQLAILFLTVGKAAKASTAYKAAYDYLRSGISLVDSAKNWEEDYALLFELYLQLSECSFFAGKKHESEQVSNLLLQHAKTANEKLEVYAVMVRMFANEGKFEKCYNILAMGFKLYGIHLKLNPSDLQILLAYLKIAWSLRKNIKKLENAPIADVNKMTLLHFWQFAGAPLYIFDVKTFAYVQLIVARHIFKEGLTNAAPGAIFGLGIVIWSAFNRKKGLAIMDLAMKMSQKCKPFQSHRIIFYSSLFRDHYHEPLSAVIKNFVNETYPACYENGEFILAAGSYNTYYGGNFAVVSLQELSSQLNEADKIYKRLNVYDYAPALKGFRMIISFLTEKEDGANFQTEIDKIINSLGDNNVSASTFYPEVYILYFFKNDIINALKIGNMWFEDYVLYADGAYIQTIHILFYFLILADAYSNASRKEQKIYLNRMKEIAARFKEYNDFYPANHAHLHFLCQAELAKLNGYFLEAIAYYDKAIEHVKSQQFMIYMALINERAGQYCLKTNPKFARSYIQEAQYFYHLWGATIKVKQLENQYPELFKKIESEMHLSHTMTNVISTTAANVDLMTIAKLTQAISREIDLAALLRKLVNLLIEYTGAQKAAILFKEKDLLHVVAQAESKGEEEVHIGNILLDKLTNLPKTIIDYVKRSNERVILNEPSQFESFNLDPYISQANPQSVLCVPIMQSTHVVCYIYLENRLCANMFTPEHLRVFELLAVQMGISIENARLYDSTNRFVPKPLMKILKKDSVLELSPGECVEKKVTAMFTDIRNYTTLSEQMTPNEAFSFINEYIVRMSPIIRKYHGFIVQYLGDGTLSLYPRDADDAIKAALEMEMALVEFNQEQKLKNKPQIKVGYGINSGDAMLGLLGEQKRLDTSVVSDAVNLASRIQNLNKIYNTTMLMTDSTVELLSNPSRFDFRLIDKVRVKGREHPTYLYEILPSDSSREENIRKAKLHAFKQAFTEYEKNQFPKAVKLFADYIRENPDDTPAKILRDRCERFIKEGVPMDWNGTITLLVKGEN